MHHSLVPSSYKLRTDSINFVCFASDFLSRLPPFDSEILHLKAIVSTSKTMVEHTNLICVTFSSYSYMVFDLSGKYLDLILCLNFSFNLILCIQFFIFNSGGITITNRIFQFFSCNAINLFFSFLCFFFFILLSKKKNILYYIEMQTQVENSLS